MAEYSKFDRNNKANRTKQGANYDRSDSHTGKPQYSRKKNSASQSNERSGKRDFKRDYRNPDAKDTFAMPSYDAGISEGGENSGLVIGRNAVRELLKTDRDVDKLLVQKGERVGSIVVLVAEAIEKGIPVVEVEKAKLDSLAAFAPHQGVIAMAAEKEYSTVEDIIAIAEERGEAPLIVIADGITDPYNLGALIRCAEGVGAHGLIIPKRRASGLTPLVTKASAGAIEHLAIAKVSNIAGTIETLKKKNIWIYSAEAGGQNYYDTDFSGGCAIVFGSEGNGVSKIVKDNSDFITSIPMYGHVNSFNVSTAAAVILAEASRQHRNAKKN